MNRKKPVCQQKQTILHEDQSYIQIDTMVSLIQRCDVVITNSVKIKIQKKKIKFVSNCIHEKASGLSAVRLFVQLYSPVVNSSLIGFKPWYMHRIC